MKVSNVNVYGLNEAIITSRYPMIADTEEFRKKIDMDYFNFLVENGLDRKIKILDENKDLYSVKENYIEMKIKDDVVAKISIEDLEKIHKYKWSHLTGDSLNYVRNSTDKYKLHRYIANCGEDEIVDHVNHDPLDCRRSNLRVCTIHENGMNKCKKTSNKSGVTGVSWDSQTSKWRSSITYKGKFKNIGRYENFEDAVRSRLNAEKLYFGEYSPQVYLFDSYGIEVPDVSSLGEDKNIKELINAYKIAIKLANTPTGAAHDNFLNGITVNFDLTCSIQLYQEAQRYRFLYFVSSTSKMHRLHQMNIDKCCNEYVDEKIKDIVNCKQQEY
ncbi:MAG: HNH endonuclease, partial [Sarcina sp.]